MISWTRKAKFERLEHYSEPPNGMSILQFNSIFICYNIWIWVNDSYWQDGALWSYISSHIISRLVALTISFLFSPSFSLLFYLPFTLYYCSVIKSIIYFFFRYTSNAGAELEPKCLSIPILTVQEHLISPQCAYHQSGF